MISGELAFPDEEPPEDWRELRLGTPSGMVTVRREPGRVVLVVWGNADTGLIQAWNALTWAFAATASGQVESSQGAVSAAEYERSAEFPAGFSKDESGETPGSSLSGF
jgi:hypothetical protein